MNTAWLPILMQLVCGQPDVSALDMLPAAPPPAETLDVVSLAGEDLDRRLTMTTLQGQVNSGDRTRLYILQAHWDPFWLDYLVETGMIDGYREISYEQALDAYSDHYTSVVHYDPAVPATMNVANMIASVEDGVVLGPGSPLGLEEGRDVTDLRGRFGTNAEAYRWALDELWPRMNHRVIAAYHPLGTSHMLRDYLVAQKVFTVWVTGTDKEDGVVSSFEEERAVFEDLMRVSPENIPMLGFVSSGLDIGMSEYAGVGLAGQYGKFSPVSNFTSNTSVMSGVPSDVQGALNAYWETELRPTPQLDPNKVYLAICVVESGDAPAYWQNRQYEVWDDPARGSVPINWSVGPGVIELLPPVFEYFSREATPLDYFYTAISGAGYVHPYRDFLVSTNDPEHAWSEYLKLTAQSMKALGSTELGLYTDAWLPFDRSALDPITERFADGIPGIEQLVMGMGRDEGFHEGNATYTLGDSDVMVSHILTRWPPNHGELSQEENIAWLIEDIRTQTPDTRPAFMTVMALSWCHDASTLTDVLDALGPEYVPVLLPEYRQLWSRAQTEGGP